MFPNKKYKIIYADPAWSYNDKRGGGNKKHGGATAHYSTMDIAEIKSLPVADIADTDCLLFIWVTFPLLQEGLDTIKAWGFEYKTLGFSWIKTNPVDKKPFFGMGWYTKSNCEVCLIGVKGKPFKASNKVSSVVIAPRSRHSEKPVEIRDKIVEFAGDVPRIELFARQSAPGWDSWGNEVIELLGINMNNLRQLQHRKTIYWVKKEGRKVFYDAEQVNAYKVKRDKRLAKKN